MAFSLAEATTSRAVSVSVDGDTLSVDLSDGRSIAAPLSWYPRLAHTQAERGRWRMIAGGEGIHWPDLDEDISVKSMLAGKPSGESRESLQQLAGGTAPMIEAA